MHSEFFDCSICLSTFNTTERRPKILPDCGHTICFSCLKEILKLQRVCCPLDRKPLDKNLTNIDLVPTNMLILQMLDGNSQERLCKTHNQPMKFYCVVDKCEICEKCVGDSGAHQGHFVENISEIFSKAAAKKNRLKGMLGDFEAEANTLHELLEENKKNTIAVMKEKFAKLYNVIYKKEQEISTQIDSLFNKEKSRVENKINTDISLREIIRSKIANLSQIEINDCLIKALEDDLSGLDFNASAQYSEAYSRSKEIQINIETAFHDLMCLAGFAIEEFKPLSDEFLLLERQVLQEGNLLLGRSLLRVEIEHDWLVIYPVCPEDNLNEVERGNILNISKSKDLTKVCLDFRKKKLCKEMAANLKELWKELKDFSCVKLFLTNTEFTDQDLIDLCAYDFWCDKKVQDLWIYLITTKIGEEGVKKLAQVIDGQNIKSFVLDCSSSTFNNACLRKVAKDLVYKLQKVESFDLRVTGTDVGDLGLENLFKELMKVATHLQTLNLWFDNTQFKEKGFDCLVKNLFPLMRNLVNLDLRIPKYENSTGNYMKLILEGVGGHLLKLKKLGLNCWKPGMSEQMKKYVEQWKRTHTRVNFNF